MKETILISKKHINCLILCHRWIIKSQKDNNLFLKIIVNNISLSATKNNFSSLTNEIFMKFTSVLYTFCNFCWEVIISINQNTNKLKNRANRTDRIFVFPVSFVSPSYISDNLVISLVNWEKPSDEDVLGKEPQLPWFSSPLSNTHTYTYFSS